MRISNACSRDARWAQGWIKVLVASATSITPIASRADGAIICQRDMPLA